MHGRTVYESKDEMTCDSFIWQQYRPEDRPAKLCTLSLFYTSTDLFRRSAFNTTTSELADIPIAAIHGAI